MAGLYDNAFPLPGNTDGTLLPLTGNEYIAADTQLPNGENPQTEGLTLDLIAGYMGGSLPLTASKFYGVPRGATPGTVLTVTGTLYAYPFYIATPVTIKTLNLNTTTGQTGGAAHIGLYADNGLGYPGALVANSDGGALIATSGAAGQHNTVNLNLNSGWYWLASIFTASGTFPTVSSIATGYASDSHALLGSDTLAHLIATSSEATSGIQVAATYGALSGINGGVFPASATLTIAADTPLVVLGT